MANNPFSIDEAVVRQLAGLLDETKLTEIEYAWGEHRIRVTRAPAPVQATAFAAPPQGQPAGTPAAPEAPAENLSHHPGAVKSPMVGTAYLAPQPGSPPFVKVGDQVNQGQPLLIIEAMKVMNQIKAPKSGKLARILIDDSSPVEFDQVIMLIE